MICGTTFKLKSIQITSCQVGNEYILFSTKVKSLGVILDNTLSMDATVSHIRRTCYFELRKIAHMRSYLNEDSTKKLVLSLVISRLDYCNSLFYNMSQENIHQLQLVQNHAARLVKRASKRCSATQLLQSLHWLPVQQRIKYKISVLVYLQVDP